MPPNKKIYFSTEIVRVTWHTEPFFLAKKATSYQQQFTGQPIHQATQNSTTKPVHQAEPNNEYTI